MSSAVSFICLLLSTLTIVANCEELVFTGWHDKLADRKKKLYDNSTQMITLQITRELATTAIMKHYQQRMHEAAIRRSGTPVGTDIYEFGVYTGGGLRKWLQMIRSINGTFEGHVWGFDSFVGMPNEDNRYKSRLRQKDAGWLVGGLNAAEQMGIRDWNILCRTLIKNIGEVPSNRIHMIRGFYNQSLKKGIAPKLGMRPAFIVDLDCDLYTSSKEALRFVLKYGIMQHGTYLYLDDVMPWKWKDKKTGSEEQKLAFEEVSREFDLEWEEINIHSRRSNAVSVRPVLMLKRCGKCRRTVRNEKVTRNMCTSTH